MEEVYTDKGIFNKDGENILRVHKDQTLCKKRKMIRQKHTFLDWVNQHLKNVLAFLKQDFDKDTEIEEINEIIFSVKNNFTSTKRMAISLSLRGRYRI